MLPNGTVNLARLGKAPEHGHEPRRLLEILLLLDNDKGDHFRKITSGYNNALAFTSIAMDRDLTARP